MAVSIVACQSRRDHKYKLRNMTQLCLVGERFLKLHQRIERTPKESSLLPGLVMDEARYRVLRVYDYDGIRLAAVSFEEVHRRLI
jgi:hypothetical protein